MITLAIIPLPLALVVLLALPWPLAAEARILSVVERILRQPVLGTELISFGTTASAIALGSQIYSTTTIYAKRSDDYDSLSPNQQCGYRATKLRAERNWWISALSLCLWLMLYKISKVRPDAGRADTAGPIGARARPRGISDAGAPPPRARAGRTETERRGTPARQEEQRAPAPRGQEEGRVGRGHGVHMT